MSSLWKFSVTIHVSYFPPCDGLYLLIMPMWFSVVSALSMNTQRHVMSVVQELHSVLQCEGSVQGDTQVRHGKSLF